MRSARITAVSLCAVVCLAFLGIATPHADAAPVLMQLRGPDLIIQEIILREQTSGEFTQVRISVRVRNRSNGAAGPSELALIYSQNVLSGPNPVLVLTKTTGTIAAGAYEELDFVIEAIVGAFRGMLVAVADAPVAGSPSGQVREGRPLMAVSGAGGPTDTNNGFAVIFDTTGRTLPVRWKNPAAQ